MEAQIKELEIKNKKVGDIHSSELEKIDEKIVQWKRNIQTENFININV